MTTFRGYITEYTNINSMCIYRAVRNQINVTQNENSHLRNIIRDIFSNDRTKISVVFLHRSTAQQGRRRAQQCAIEIMACGPALEPFAIRLLARAIHYKIHTIARACSNIALRSTVSTTYSIKITQG